MSTRTAYKWLTRYRSRGRPGLMDRSSRPHRCPHQATAERCAQIVALRRQRCTYRDISQRAGLSMSTVARVLRRHGLNRLARLDPPPATRRYVWDHPGDLLHLDIKKLGRFRRPGHRVTRNRHVDSRGAGWEYVHVAIDDASRVSFAAIAADETALSACRALLATLRYFARFGVTFRRVMTDNGPCYCSRTASNDCAGG